ncbi:hypothetical protein [Qipengyuania vesicularis]|uniref:hypothetical protein n=1 Tax=Qipengyuania vesicularis TaxID=2867232 RepID=UPI001C881A28|nr:hypothetical protein [Qipengyuania vesicularis]MBX7528084.1 hypothetical protein [Qipengyuania vesicularis]
MSDSFDTPGIIGRSWFRPAVAAWFGVLAAAGMWFMPPSVHATIMQTTGLAQLSPLFAPPVSNAGVLLVCSIAAIVGALLGFLIARSFARIAAPRAFAPGFEFHDESSWEDGRQSEEEEPFRRRRVFSAREDIGEEGIAISAPVDEDGSYEDEFSIEDVPPVTPEEDFDAVYAEMEPDYVPASEQDPVVEDYDPVELENEPVVEEAEFVEVDDAEYEPAPADEPEPVRLSGADWSEPEQTLDTEDVATPEVPLGDMSLDALLDRLEGALEAHKSMVATSEEASEQAPPRTVPMARETAELEDEADESGLPEASDDDPVIAFLRREARRRMPQKAANEELPESEPEPEPKSSARPSQAEAYAALRSALDRLGQSGGRE